MAVAFIAIMALPFISAWLDEVARLFFLNSARALIYPLSLVSSSFRAALAQMGDSLSLDESLALASRAGQIWLWLAIPAQVGAFVYLVLEWKKSRRKFGAWDLLLELEPNKPCLSPIIKSGPITKKDPLKGPWALAETPLGFVVKIGAYLDDYLTPVEPDSILNPATGLPIDWGEWPKKPSLDDEIVRAALAAQLGPTFRGVTDLKISQSHLAMAFWTQIVEGKRKALDILAQLNRNWDPKALTTYSPLAEEALSKFNPIDLPPEIDCHRHFQNPFMMALLFKAKKRGIISPSLYIWLKPTDRSLFYSLNQVGAQMAWIEGLGPWSHYLAEARAQTPLADPAVEEALVSLKKTLANERFLPNPVLDAQDEAIRAENEAYRDLIRQGLSPEEASAALSQSYSP